MMRIAPLLMIGRTTGRSSLTFLNRFTCAQASTMLMDRGELHVRNSDTFEIKLYKVNNENMQVEPISISFDSTATLQQVKQVIQRQIPFEGLKFLSQQNVPISELTPVDSLVTRFFTINSPEYSIKVEGQLLHPNLEDSKQVFKNYLRQSLKQVEQPVFIQREIQSYIMRVQTWISAKYPQQNATIPPKEAKKILVQALADPECPWSAIRQLQNQWRTLYNEVAELRTKLDEAVKESEKMAKRRMYLDLVALAGNIAFIWGGTYVVYSWDIIQPWAYFISSAAGIYLFRKSAQLRKPFSLTNYRNHLIYEVYLTPAALQVGLDLDKLDEKQKQLKLLQTTFKDSLITKL